MFAFETKPKDASQTSAAPPKQLAASGTQAGQGGSIGLLQQMIYNQAARGSSAMAAPAIQRKMDPALVPASPAAGPTQATPTRVTGTDDHERYQAVQDDIARFNGGAPYFLHNHKPSTGRGFFDALYYPPKFIVTVKVKFGFADSDVESWTGAKETDVTWTEAEKEAWKQRFLTEVSAKWSNEKTLLFCVRPGWESLAAQVVVNFADVNKSAPPALGLGKGDVKPHYDLLITKIPPGRQLQALTIPPVGTRDEGVANLDSQGLDPRRNESGHSQRSAVHESGHMLGLGDTYEDTSTVMHGKLAEKELGAKVPVKDDGRLMSRGDSIERADAVTFVEAIRKATKMPEWSLTAKAPGVPPRSPELINDGVTPAETVV